MSFGIIDSSGNFLAWYDDEEGARSALDRMVDADPGAAEHLAVIQFDDQGDPVGEAILPPRTKVVITESRWLKPGEREFAEPAPAQAGPAGDGHSFELAGA